ncbi:ABC transporter permease [Nakamurella lactea]|uniref:ABC transporter permease n=1 Tax=Nakamurella lactea TaxID=459515 RepID=UPI0004088DA7|nr:ABC transporter permease [Nakamurella lactea]
MSTSAPPPIAEPVESGPPTGRRSPTALLRRVWRDPGGRIGIVLMVLMILLALLGVSGLLPHGPIDQAPQDRLQGPSGRYWFGTDQFGRDIAARTFAGIFTSLRVSVVSVLAAAVIGTFLGVLAGFLGGWVDQVIGRLIDILFAFPAILLALALVSALGSGWVNTAIAITVVYAPIFARVARGPTLSVAGSEYIRAGRVLGIPTSRLLLRHVLPNVAAPIVVQVTLALSWAILTESALSFLGLGTQAPDASLGLMVSDARNLVSTAWWTLVFPAAAIVLLVIGLNLLGDGLRSALDPRQTSGTRPRRQRLTGTRGRTS